MLTEGKQRQESTVRNVASMEGKKERASKLPEKQYVPQFLSFYLKKNGV